MHKSFYNFFLNINLVNICVGLYSPLKGFCDYRDYCSIIEKNKINNNINWTIPILLNSSLKKKGFFRLKYKSKIVGALDVKSIFKRHRCVAANLLIG